MKEARQAKILELISAQPIQTQEELAAALAAQGIIATQATVSRDVKELRLIKTQDAQGGVYRYASAGLERSAPGDRLTRIFAEAVVSINGAENIIVIKTLSGSAPGAAEAVDNLPWPEVIGTLAGDNTIMVVLESKACMQTMLERLRVLARR